MEASVCLFPGRRAMSILALCCLCIGGTAQAGKLGNPVYSMDTVSLDASLNVTTPVDFVDSQRHAAPNGDLVGGVIWYPTPTQRAESVGGGIFNQGVTYWIMGRTPMYTGSLPRLSDSIAGGRSRIDIRQSFRKERADAEATFIYSAASMQLKRDIEGGRQPCDECILGRVGWTAEVYLDELAPIPIWSQTQTATLTDHDGILNLTIDDSSNGIGTNNPTWAWDCAACGGTSFGLGTASLDAPFRGSVDLSGIAFDSNLPASQQTEFTVHFVMDWLAYDQTRFGQMSVFTRDPLGADDSGVGLEIAGLIPTDNPIGVVPEPGTLALMFAGLALISLKSLRRWRRLATGAATGAVGGMALLAVTAPAQAQALLTERYATTWGYFVMGYRTLSDSGNEEITRDDVQAIDTFEVFDSGLIDSTTSGQPVNAIADFRSALTHAFAPGAITASGSTFFYAAGSPDYVLAGGRSGSNARFAFTLDRPTEYHLVFDLHGTSTDPRDLLLRASFGFESGSALHILDGIGHYEASGMLPQGDYGISARATAYNNQSGDYSYSLVLGPVPEPPPAALALAGLAVFALLLRRRAPA